MRPAGQCPDGARSRPRPSRPVPPELRVGICRAKSCLPDDMDRPVTERKGRQDTGVASPSKASCRWGSILRASQINSMRELLRLSIGLFGDVTALKKYIAGL